jgi:DNA-directed RNA polymerase subunit D
MKASKITSNKEKLVFLLEGCTDTFANTIRRMILEEVPTLAIEDVEIKDNNTALYDEMLALRLGLIPIKTDLTSYRLPKNEDEITERSAQCTLQIKLKSAKKGVVRAGDAESADSKCTFVQSDVPVVKLLSKQKLDLTMTAVVGQGKEHTKWSPGMAFYKKEAIVKVGKVKDPKFIADSSSDGVFTLKAGSLSVNADKVNASHLLNYYAELDEGINVTYTDNKIFTVESWGQLSCKDMLTKSAEILFEKAEEMESEL